MTLGSGLKIAFLAVLIGSALFVHFRGRERHRFRRQLTDHSTFTAPYNALMVLFSGVPTTPRVDRRLFPELEVLEREWRVLRDEALALMEQGRLRASDRYDDVAFNSFFRRGWKRFYLKWYGDFLPSARAACPRSCRLLEGIPSVNAALFAVLPPRSQLVRHRDPFGGSLRYHLGLSTPNSDDCYILIDGQPYSWRDGEGVVFDATYIHRARNDTDRPRLILFCDVSRPLRLRWLDRVNRFVARHVVPATQTRNVPGEKVGWVNRGFGAVYRIRLAGKWLRQKNETLYFALKYVGIGLGLYAFFAWA